MIIAFFLVKVKKQTSRVPVVKWVGLSLSRSYRLVDCDQIQSRIFHTDTNSHNTPVALGYFGQVCQFKCHTQTYFMQASLVLFHKVNDHAWRYLAWGLLYSKRIKFKTIDLDIDFVTDYDYNCGYSHSVYWADLTL